MRGHFVPDLVGSPSAIIPGAPGFLIRYVVGNFRLIEINASAVAVPKRLVFLGMLHGEAVINDIVAIHHHTVFVDSFGPSMPIAVIGAPEPCVVADDIVAVDRNHGVRTTGTGS